MKRRMIACVLLVASFTLIFSSIAYATTAIGSWRNVPNGRARATVQAVPSRQIRATVQFQANRDIPASWVRGQAMIINDRGQRVNISAWRVHPTVIRAGQTVTVQQIARVNVPLNSNWRGQGQIWTAAPSVITTMPQTPFVRAR